MKKIICSFFIAILFISIALPSFSADTKLTKKDAVETAGKEATRLGYTPENMSFSVNYYRTPWNDFLDQNSSDAYSVERMGKLKGKEYYAVYYFPKPQSGEIQLGGDFCIFVDSKSGEIITNIRWR